MGTSRIFFKIFATEEKSDLRRQMEKINPNIAIISIHNHCIISKTNCETKFKAEAKRILSCYSFCIRSTFACTILWEREEEERSVRRFTNNSKRAGSKDDSFGKGIFPVGQAALLDCSRCSRRNESSMVRTKSREVDINK